MESDFSFSPLNLLVYNNMGNDLDYLQKKLGERKVSLAL